MIKNICCIGAGYVGGPTMAVIALKCPDIKVTVVDANKEKISKWNSSNLDDLPVFEPGLKEVIMQTRDKNLFFSTEIDSAIDRAQMIFMAVNTPTKEKGKGAGMATDLKYVESCAKNIARVAKNDKIVIEKSTLPVRTAEKIKEILSGSINNCNFDVISNPEFLAEGTAINDLFKSDRVLIGGENSKSGKIAVKKLVEIYKRWIPENKILTVNVWSAELSKLASNAMLAQRISSINSLSAICEATGAEIDEVSNAIGKDHRIGPYFLKVSPGFGGSCFQKDILSLVYLSKFYGLDEVAEYWHQVIKINDYQRSRIVDKICSFTKKNKLQREVSILGWSFKKDTNDSRESSSIYVAYQLLERKFKITIYDPKVSSLRIIDDLNNLNKKIGGLKSKTIDSSIKIVSDLNEVKKSESIAVVMTEWDEFKKIDFSAEKIFLFDFRNFINSDKTTIRF